MTPAGLRSRASGPVSSGPGSVDARLPFTVDSWGCAELRHLGRPGFLTHAHGDHTQGIAAWANSGPGRELYCSHDTWRLVCFKIPELSKAADLGAVKVFEVEVGESFTASCGDQRFEVTAVDANHCQGSVMYVFQGSFGSVLHSGDCRLTPRVTERLQQHLWQTGVKQLDLMYLDCTFASFPRDFPSIAEATRHVKDVIGDPWQHARVYLACEGLGSEPLLRAIANKWQLPVYVPDHPSKGVAFHGDNSPSNRGKELRLLLEDWMITDDPRSTPFHICGGRELHKPAMRMIRAAKKQGKTEPLFVRPSVQAFHIEYDGSTEHAQAVAAGSVTVDKAPSSAETKQGVHHVLYSNHSSFPELCNALASLSPRLMVPHSVEIGRPLHPDLRSWTGGDVDQALSLQPPAPAADLHLAWSTTTLQKKRKIGKENQPETGGLPSVSSNCTAAEPSASADLWLEVPDRLAWMPPLEEYQDTCPDTCDVFVMEPVHLSPKCGVTHGANAASPRDCGLQDGSCPVADTDRQSRDPEASGAPQGGSSSEDENPSPLLQDEKSFSIRQLNKASTICVPAAMSAVPTAPDVIRSSADAGASDWDLISRAIGFELPPIVCWND